MGRKNQSGDVLNRLFRKTLTPIAAKFYYFAFYVWNDTWILRIFAGLFSLWPATCYAPNHANPKSSCGAGFSCWFSNL